MVYPEDPAFEQFVTQQRRALQRIARSTQGEHLLSDVINEAWLVSVVRIQAVRPRTAVGDPSEPRPTAYY